jgi:diamine N-acetyltransferase
MQSRVMRSFPAHYRCYMPVTIRQATPGDSARLAEVAAITFPLACPPHTTDAAKAAFIAEHLSEPRFAEYVADADRILLIAEESAEDGQAGAASAIGYTMLVFGEPHDTDVAAALRIRPAVELSKCYVLPGHHGAGVAGMLMSASLDAARARGAVGVWLGVNEENAKAQRFYGKHGFEKVGTKHFKVGDKLEDDHVLELAL